MLNRFSCGIIELVLWDFAHISVNATDGALLAFRCFRVNQTFTW